METSKMISHNLYYRLLGPYMYEFCVRLYSYVKALNESGKTKVYFCTRSGFVLKYLFDLFLKNINLSINCELIIFPTSRISLLKALVGASPLYAGQQAASMFSGQSIEKLIVQLYKGKQDINIEEYLTLIPDSILVAKVSPWAVKAWIDFDKENIKGVLSFISYSIEQADLIREYFDGDIDNHIVVDSGLYGSTIGLLSALVPEKKILAAMVYLSNNRYANPAPHIPNCFGVMGHSDVIDFKVPHSGILLHWHLIENLLEPENVNSVKNLPIAFNLESIEFNANTLEVFNYFNTPFAYDIKNILFKLLKTLAVPSPKDIEKLFSGKVQDDVNGTQVSVVIPSEMEQFLRKRDKLRRVKYGIIRRSLWKPAQLVSSYGILGRLINICSWYWNRIIK